jgi:hypothetical protein
VTGKWNLPPVMRGWSADAIAGTTGNPECRLATALGWARHTANARYRRDPVTRPSQLELALLPQTRHSLGTRFALGSNYSLTRGTPIVLSE